MKTILNIATLLIVALIGYIIWKVYQSVAATGSAVSSGITSIQSDASSAYNALTSLWPFSSSDDSPAPINDPLNNILSPPSNLVGAENLQTDTDEIDAIPNAQFDAITQPTLVGAEDDGTNSFGF